MPPVVSAVIKMRLTRFARVIFALDRGEGTPPQ
jgi:hypothetical protein